MDKTKPTDPHAIEGYSKAHGESFDALVERISKAAQREKPPHQELAGHTHKAYPRSGGIKP